MPIRVQLENDKVLRLDIDLDEWKRVFQRAQESGEPIEVKNSRGQVLFINPRQVQFWAPAEQEVREAALP